jgi:hypothetical protein
LKAAADPVYGPLQPVRDEIAGWEKSVNEKTRAIAAQRIELAGFQKQLTSGKKLEGTNEVALSGEDLVSLSNKVADVQAAMAPTPGEVAELNKQINARQLELSEKYKPVAAQLRQLRFLTNRVADIAAGQATVARLQADIATGQQDVATRAKDLNLAAGTVAERQSLLAAKQKELADLREKNKGLYDQLAAKRKEFYAKKDLADAQQNVFSVQFRRKYADADTYGQMYALLGQQLEVASQLLSHTNVQQRRSGLVVAVQAADMCATFIQNQWLATRIFEGYVMPCLGLADDPKFKMPLNPDNLLQQMVAYHRAAQEPERVIETLKLAARNAKVPATADRLRFLLGKEYEQTARLTEAVAAYRSIVDTNAYRGVVNQIPYLEQRAKRK